MSKEQESYMKESNYDMPRVLLIIACTDMKIECLYCDKVNILE